jgi:membrane-bound acyltransferase YfiQ involved in biofilm formation
VFLIGFLLAHSPDFWQAVERQRWSALVVAVALYAVFISLRSMSGGGMPVRITAVTAYGCYQWLCMVAVLGFARRWLNTDSRARRYLTNAIFPYYIVHQTAIIMIAHALQSSGLSAGAEAAIVIGGTAITCIVTFEIVRRVAWLRPLFGLKRLEAASVVGLRASGQAAR